MRLTLLSLLLGGTVVAAPVPFTMTAGADPYVVEFDGFSGGTVIDGLSARLTFSDFVFTNLAARTRVDFRLDIENTSDAPLRASRISAIGFGTEENVVRSASRVSGDLGRISSGVMASGLGSIDFCFTSVTCAGGGSAGVTQGNTGTVYASLLLSGRGLTSLTFDDVFVRYQSISGAGRITSAVGAPVTPEPSAYLVLLGGAFLIAQRVRSRRRADIS